MSQRLENLKELPGHLGNAARYAGKAFRGGAWTPVAGATLSLWKTANEQADKTRHSRAVLPEIFNGAVRVINPKAKVIGANDLSCSFFNHIPAKLLKFAVKCANSQSFLTRHVISRGASSLGALTAVITGIADMILAVPTTALALITFGCSDKINHIAAQQLTFPEALHFIGSGLRLFVNPHPRIKIEQQNCINVERVKALKKNSSITSIDLGNNNIGDEGAKALKKIRYFSAKALSI